MQLKIILVAHRQVPQLCGQHTDLTMTPTVIDLRIIEELVGQIEADFFQSCGTSSPHITPIETDEVQNILCLRCAKEL